MHKQPSNAYPRLIYEVLYRSIVLLVSRYLKIKNRLTQNTRVGNSPLLLSNIFGGNRGILFKNNPKTVGFGENFPVARKYSKKAMKEGYVKALGNFRQHL